MTTEVPLGRVVAIESLLGDSRRVGSGFLVTPRRVLTAWHCTVDHERPEEKRQLRIRRRAGNQWQFADAQVIASSYRIQGDREDKGLDVAVLEIAGEPPWGDPDWPSLEYAALAREWTGELAPCVGVGFPQFMLGEEVELDTTEVRGTIRLGEAFTSSSLVLRDPRYTDVATRSFKRYPELQNEPAWGGFSGTLVFHQGRLVGHVVLHWQHQGAGALIVVPYAEIVESTDPSAQGVARALGLEVAPPLESGARAESSGEAPAPPSVVRLDFVVPHEEALYETGRRRRFLQEDELPFYGPGAGHPTDPNSLLKQLGDADDGRGILLVGVAGAGKSRTCHEVARRAVPVGWRVLHVQADPFVTTADVKFALQPTVQNPTLLVIDYLDVCGGLDLRELSTWIALSQASGAGPIKLLATARPATMLQPALTRADQVLIGRELRADPEFTAELSRHIVASVAPRALEQLGEATMHELCGERPGIAVLIARVLEERVVAGLSPDLATPVELIEWVRDRLTRDGLLAAPAGGLFRSGAVEPVVIAAALAAVACPAPRSSLDASVEHLLHALAVDATSGHDVVQTMLGIGWLTLHDGWVEVVHDLVADEMLRAVVIRRPGVVEKDRFLAMLNSVAGVGHPLGSFARAVARVYLEEPSGVQEHLSELCSTWTTENGAALGDRFVTEVDSDHTMTALLHGDPWQGGILKSWDHVVQPWMRHLAGDVGVGSFLISLLGGLPDGRSGPLARTALIWLRGNGSDPDAHEFIRLLLKRHDLDPDQLAAVVEHALTWVGGNPDHPATPGVLMELLRSPAGQREEVAQLVVECVEAGSSLGLGRVLGELLSLRPTPAKRAVRVRQAARSWLTRNGSLVETHWPLQALLESHLPELDRAWAERAALTWLGRHGAQPVAARVLAGALIEARSGGERSSALAYSLEWLRLFEPIRDDASWVLSALLKQTPSDSEAHDEVVAAAQTWLSMFARRFGATFVLDPLLEPSFDDHSNPPPEWAVDAGLTHVESTTRAEASWALRALLRADHEWDAERALRLQTAVLIWLNRQLDTPDAAHVLAPVLTWKPLDAKARDVLVRLAVQWLDQHVTDMSGSAVVLTALTGIVGDPEADASLAAHVRTAAEKLRARRSPGPQHSFVVARMAHAGLLTDDSLQSVLDEVATGLLEFPDSPQLPPVLVNLLGLARSGRTAPLPPEVASVVREAAVQWLKGHEQYAELPDVLIALAASHGGHGPTQEVVVQTSCRWLEAYPAHPRATAVTLCCLGMGPTLRLDLRSTLVQAVLGWRRARAGTDSDSAVMTGLVRLNVDQATRSELVSEVFAWADSHPGRPEARRLLAGVVLGRADYHVPVPGAFATQSIRIIHSLLTNVATAQRIKVVEEAITWLRRHPDDPAWQPMMLAVLRGKVPAPASRARAYDLCTTRLRRGTMDGSDVTLLCALANAKWLGLSDQVQAIEGLLAVVRGGTMSPFAAQVFQAIATSNPSVTQRTEAMRLLADWWDTTPVMTHTGFALTAMLHEGSHDVTEAAVPLARRAISLAAADLDLPRAVPLLSSCLAAFYLPTELLVEVMDIALDQAEVLLSGPGSARLMSQVIRTSRQLEYRRLDTARRALEWMEAGPNVPQGGRVAVALAASDHLIEAQRDRLVDLCLTWVRLWPQRPEANYYLQAALSAASTSRRPDVIAEVRSWAADHPDSDGVPHVYRCMGELKPQSGNNVNDPMRVVIDYVDAHLNRGDSHVAVRGLVQRRPPDQALHREVVDCALRWLRVDVGREEAFSVLKGLLDHPPCDADQRRNLTVLTLEWLRTYPAHNAFTFVVEAALSSDGLDLDYEGDVFTLALDWLRVNGATPTAENVVKGVLKRGGRVADSDLRRAAAIAVSSWMDDAPQSETWVLRRALVSPLFDPEERRRLFARATALLASVVTIPRRGEFWGRLIVTAQRAELPDYPVATLVDAAICDTRLDPRDLNNVISSAVGIPDLSAGAVSRFVDLLEGGKSPIRFVNILRPLVTSPGATAQDVQRLLRLVVGMLSTTSALEGLTMLRAFPDEVSMDPQTTELLDTWVRDSIQGADPATILVAAKVTAISASSRAALRRALLDALATNDEVDEKRGRVILGLPGLTSEERSVVLGRLGAPPDRDDVPPSRPGVLSRVVTRWLARTRHS